MVPAAFACWARRCPSWTATGSSPSEHETEKLLIIADDLSGALDTGVQFAALGLRVAVLRGGRLGDGPSGGGPPGAELWGRADVLALDTASRHHGPAEASARLRGMAATHAAVPGLLVYKKTDSTLRGNIAAEFAALLLMFPGRRILFVPAYPAMGRTTRGGVQYLDGTAVHETAFGRDPLNPVTTSSIRELLASGGLESVRNLAARDVRAALGSAPEQILVVDAETDADIDTVVRAVAGFGGAAPILAGCAGFAAALARGWAADRDTGAADPDTRAAAPAATDAADRAATHRRGLERPFLVVNGSLHGASLAQVDRAARGGFPAVTLGPRDLLSCGNRDGGADALAAALVAQRGQERGPERPLLLRTAGDTGDRTAQTPPMTHAEVADAIGRVVGKTLALRDFGTLVVFGGDTAGAILDALGNPPLFPVGELAPGVALSRIGGGALPALVTKAGGFGNEDFLLDLLEESASTKTRTGEER
jgi:uncharacterized protein YgbK (DUF1537 family)